MRKREGENGEVGEREREKTFGLKYTMLYVRIPELLKNVKVTHIYIIPD